MEFMYIFFKKDKVYTSMKSQLLKISNCDHQFSLNILKMMNSDAKKGIHQNPRNFDPELNIS
jgi:hypothetical protein